MQLSTCKKELCDVFLSFNPVKQLSTIKKEKKNQPYVQDWGAQQWAIFLKGHWALCQVPACPWVRPSLKAILHSIDSLCTSNPTLASQSNLFTVKMNNNVSFIIIC